MTKKIFDEMPFLAHPEDLRWLLVRSTIAILIMATMIFFVSDYIFDVIIFGPTHPDFITYRFFCELSHYVGFNHIICITELPFIIQNTNIEGQVNVLLWDLYCGRFHLFFSLYTMAPLDFHMSCFI